MSRLSLRGNFCFLLPLLPGAGLGAPAGGSGAAARSALVPGGAEGFATQHHRSPSRAAPGPRRGPTELSMVAAGPRPRGVAGGRAIRRTAPSAPAWLRPPRPPPPAVRGAPGRPARPAPPRFGRESRRGPARGREFRALPRCPAGGGAVHAGPGADRPRAAPGAASRARRHVPPGRRRPAPVAAPARPAAPRQPPAEGRTKALPRPAAAAGARQRPAMSAKEGSKVLLLTPHATSERAVKGERPAAPQREHGCAAGGAVTAARGPGPAWAAVPSMCGPGGQPGSVRRRGMPARAWEYRGPPLRERGAGGAAGGSGAGACGPSASRPERVRG